MAENRASLSDQFACEGCEVCMLATELADERAEVARLRAALEKIAAISLPYRDTAKLARHLAREALNGGDT